MTGWQPLARQMLLKIKIFESNFIEGRCVGMSEFEIVSILIGLLTLLFTFGSFLIAFLVLLIEKVIKK